MPKRTSLLVVLAIVLALVLAACGDATSTAPAATTTAAATTAGATTAAATTAAATTAAGATTAAASGSVSLSKDQCPNPNTPASSGEIKIGLGAPLTGGSAPLGIAIQRGAEMAAEEINNCGGINGKKVTFVIRDDQAKADVGVTNIREIAENKDILAFIGTANTAVGVVQAPIVNQSKIPWVVTVTTGTAITRDTTSTPSYIFRISMVDSEQTPYVADYVSGKYKKVAVIHDETSYGQLGNDDLLKALDAKGIKPVLDETYKAGDAADDMKPMVNKIKTAAPEVVVSWGLGPANANIKKAMKDLGVSNIPFMGSWGLSMPNYQENAGGLEEGTLVPQTISVDTTNPKQLDFFNKYKKKYNTETVGFPSGLVQSYDGMWMLAMAMRQPGADSDRGKLRDALENFASYDGVIKKFDKPWSNQYHEAFTKADFIMTVWKNGKMVRLT